MSKKIEKQTEKCMNCGKNPKGGRNPIFQPHDIAEKLRKYTEDENQVIPLLEEFCFKENISYDRLNDMAGKCQELNHVIQRLKLKKKSNLVKGGLRKVFDSHFTGLTLKQKDMGWSDRVEHGVDDESREQIKELKAMLKLRKPKEKK